MVADAQAPDQGSALVQALLEAFARRAPGRFAERLAQLGTAQAGEVLSGLPARAAAPVAAGMPPSLGGQLLGALCPERAAAICGVLDPPLLANLLRYVAPDVRTAIVAGLPTRARELVARLLAHPAERVGAHTDPRVIALPVDTAVGSARDSVSGQEQAEGPGGGEAGADSDVVAGGQGIVDVVFAIDAGHVLVGVVSWHALLRARPEASIRALAEAPPGRLSVDALVETALSDPGWAHATALPVVDRDGRLAGAVRRHALLRARAEHLSEHAGPDPRETAGELAGLLGLGVSALWRLLGGVSGGDAVPTDLGDRPRQAPAASGGGQEGHR